MTSFTKTNYYHPYKSENMQKYNYLLLETILTDLGLEILQTDDAHIEVTYQDERFRFHLTGNGFIHIIHEGVIYIRHNDPWLNIIKEAANYTNYKYGYRIIWAQVNNAGFIPFHAILENVLLAPEIPDLPLLITSALNTYFTTKEVFTNIYMGLMDKSRGLDNLN